MLDEPTTGGGAIHGDFGLGFIASLSLKNATSTNTVVRVTNRYCMAGFICFELE